MTGTRPWCIFAGTLAVLVLASIATPGLTIAGRGVLQGGNPVTTVALPAPVIQYPPAQPSAMVAGTGGTMWVAIGNDTTSGLVLVGPSGVLRRVPSTTTVHGLARMDDGSLWYTADKSTAVVRISAAGTVSRFATGLPIGKYDWVGTVAPGAGGVVWFDAGEGRIVELTSAGRVIHVYRPLGDAGRLLNTDQARRVWLTTVGTGPTRIAQMTPDGSLSWQTTLPGFVPSVAYAFAPDGSLWLPLTTGLARVTAAGKLTPRLVTYSLLPGEIRSLAFDSTGTLWFATPEPSTIGSIAPGGGITLYPQLNNPVSLAFDSNGELWFAGATPAVFHTKPPPPSVCVVPDLYGDRLADARAAVESKTTCALAEPRGVLTGNVWGQSPAPDTHLPAGSTVSILLGKGKPGLSGTWKGDVTTDQCKENGATVPSGEAFPQTLRVRPGLHGRFTATLGRTTFRSTGRRGATYRFAGPSANLRLTVVEKWPKVSILLVHLNYLGCNEVDSYGDLLRTADR